MVFIGIDISKYKHDCFVIDENGELIENIFFFENNRDGFAKLCLYDFFDFLLKSS